MGLDISVNIAGMKLKNPVLVCSGTFGCGREYSEYFDINKLGGIVTKTLTLKASSGNPAPRIVETPSGMLNSIGLENPGISAFISDNAVFLKSLKTRVIVSVAGSSPDEYAEAVSELSSHSWVSGLELNISCPNLRHVRKHTFSQSCRMTAKVVAAARQATKKHLITKLSPNVTDITEIALVAEDSGTDAVSLINTLAGMAMCADTGKPVLGGITGGLSGPAIKPVALKMVYDTAKCVKVPIIAMGGIMTYSDAAEFMACGATAISVGTAVFVNPIAPLEIVEGFKKS